MKSILLSYYFLFFLSLHAAEYDTSSSNSFTNEDSISLSALTLHIDSNLTIPLVDFKSVKIADAISALMRPYNINVWISPKVDGIITVHLTDISLLDAFLFILKENILQYEIDGGIIKVLPPLEEDKYQVAIEYHDSLLTLDFQSVPLKFAVNNIIDATNLNIIIEQGTSGFLIGKLKNIPVLQGLEALFTSNGFGIKIDDGILYVSKIIDQDARISKRSAYQIGCLDGKVSLDVSNADLLRLVESIAVKCGLQLIIYGSPQGKVTAKCIDITTDEVFRFILSGTEFTFRRDKDVIRLGPKDIEEMKVNEFIKVKYVIAENLLEIIPTSLSSKIAIKIVKEQNGLIATGNYNLVEELREFVASVDFPTAQVLFEALVVDFRTNALSEFSILANNTGLAEPNATDEKYYPELQVYSSGKPADKELQSIARHLGISNIGHLSDDFYIRLKALQQEGKANVKSRPMIAALNGHEASINIGTTQYYLLKTETVYNTANTSANTQVSQRFETVKADISFKVIPWVTATGEVVVNIKPEFSTPQGNLNPDTPPTINHRVLNSTVRLRTGETIVLGGLIQSSENIEIQKLPLLGDIPILGRIFQNRKKSTIETELIIFLTPTVYYGSEGAVDISKYQN